MSLDKNNKPEKEPQKKVLKKTKSFEVKNKFTHGEKEYQKGDKIEVKTQKGIEFLQSKKYI